MAALLASQSSTDGLHEPLRANGFQLLLFCPFEDALEDRASGDKVALGLALPGEAAFDAVEAVLLAERQLVVEEALALLQLGSKGLLEAQRQCSADSWTS